MFYAINFCGKKNKSNNGCLNPEKAGRDSKYCPIKDVIDIMKNFRGND